MGKSSRMPVMAAGGIVVRGGRRPLIAVVQRRRDNAWVLPKGKLKPNEKPIAAARREAVEETGADVRVQEFLGVISYVSGSGPKIAHFWRMQAIGEADGDLLDDVKAVQWLPLSAAIERLSLPHEQFFLRNVGRKALKKPTRKAKRKPPPLKEILAAATGRPANGNHAPALTRPGGMPRLKLASWNVVVQLGRRWQAAVGRTRRAG